MFSPSPFIKASSSTKRYSLLDPVAVTDFKKRNVLLSVERSTSKVRMLDSTDVRHCTVMERPSDFAVKKSNEASAATAIDTLRTNNIAIRLRIGQK